MLLIKETAKGNHANNTKYNHSQSIAFHIHECIRIPSTILSVNQILQQEPVGSSKKSNQPQCRVISDCPTWHKHQVIN